MRAFIILAGCVAAATTGCRHQIETYRQNNISAGELRSPFQSVFAHVGQYFYLTVDGKTYKNVSGSAPFFLDVPELNSILFVTGDETHGNVKFHIVNRETGHEIVISGAQSHFGADIGGLELLQKTWDRVVILDRLCRRSWPQLRRPL